MQRPSGSTITLTALSLAAIPLIMWGATQKRDITTTTLDNDSNGLFLFPGDNDGYIVLVDGNEQYHPAGTTIDFRYGIEPNVTETPGGWFDETLVEIVVPQGGAVCDETFCPERGYYSN